MRLCFVDIPFTLEILFSDPCSRPVRTGWSRRTTLRWWPGRSRRWAAGRCGTAGSPGRSRRGTTAPASRPPSSARWGGHGGHPGTDRSVAARMELLYLAGDQKWERWRRASVLLRIILVKTNAYCVEDKLRFKWLHPVNFSCNCSIRKTFVSSEVVKSCTRLINMKNKHFIIPS